MGRKSIERTRKPLSKKMKLWVDSIIPAIAHEDLSKLTVNDIAKLTNKSKSTIYEYFESKQDIIYTAVKRRIDKLEDLPTLTTNESVIAAYNQLIEWLINHLNDVSFSLLNQLESHFAESWEIIRHFMNELLNTLQSLYKHGIEQAVFRSVSVDILMALDEFFITQWLSREGKTETIDQMIIDYVDIRLRGISAPMINLN